MFDSLCARVAPLTILLIVTIWSIMFFTFVNMFFYESNYSTALKNIQAFFANFFYFIIHSNILNLLLFICFTFVNFFADQAGLFANPKRFIREPAMQKTPPHKYSGLFAYILIFTITLIIDTMLCAS